jgi:hypothetical protein
MPPGDMHIGTAFLDGRHNDLAELRHPFLSPPDPVGISDVESAGRYSS